jgi:myo-inositol 2-dehydrogenase / D-chiro-inositol 1-dehydrogenase
MTHHIGIIGCGKQAEKHISGYRANGVQQISVTDISFDAAQNLAKRSNVNVVKSIDALFASEEITAIDICTPTPSHAPLLQLSIDHKKNFLVEKPLTSNLQEAQAIATAARRENLIGAVGFTYRYAPALASIKEIIDEGGLGKVISSTFRIGGRGSHAIWKHKKETGGGAIREMLVHMIDLAVWYFGSIETVDVLAVEQHYPERSIDGEVIVVDAEDYVLVKLASKAGQIITIAADFTTPSFVQYAEVQGASGMAFGSIQPQFTPFVWMNKEEGYYPAGKTDLKIEPHNIIANLTGNFLASLQGKETPRCSVHDAVEVQRVLEMVLKQT